MKWCSPISASIQVFWRVDLLEVTPSQKAGNRDLPHLGHLKLSPIGWMGCEDGMDNLPPLQWPDSKEEEETGD